MHLIYGEAHSNGRKAQRLYMQRFPNRRRPSHTMFAKINRRLRETGTLSTTQHRYRARTTRTLEFEEEVLNLFEERPNTSTRSIAQTVGTTNSTVWKVIHEQQLHPYRRQKVQALLPRDFVPRIEYCNWYIQRCGEDILFPQRILFTDESCFTREGLFNSHNNHVWADENPHALFIRNNQYRFSVSVWGGIVGDNLLGPYFLPPRLNAELYLEFLDQTLPELLEEVPLAIRQTMRFQHDGAPAHSSVGIRNHLNTLFPDRWIGRGGPVLWPARSPDLTPLDFFLWGHVKAIVYETPVNTINELRERIVAAFERVRNIPGIFARVRRSSLQRCHTCIQVGGAHFEQLLHYNINN